MRKPSISVFLAVFIVVLAGGVALAQVGTMSFGTEEKPPQMALSVQGDDDAGPEPETKPTTTTTTTKAPERDEPVKDEVAEKPEDETPKDEKPSEPVEEKDTTPPEFGVLSPADGAEVESKVVVFEGFVEPGAKVTRGKYEAKIDGETWRLELVVSPGKNYVTFLATDAAGNQAKAATTVYLAGYDVPKDDTPKDEKSTTKDFSANQKFGSCGDDVPYDKFWGTGIPGDTVVVVSPYGSGSTEVGKDGHWALKVHFPDAPVGEPFTVVIEASNGRAEFTFVNTGDHKGDDKG